MTTNTAILPTKTTASSSELDERNIAATALKTAEDKLQTLCATNAATFVAVEHRGAELSKSLECLISTLNDALPHVSESKRSLEMDASTDVDGKETSSSLATLAEKHRVRRRTLLQHSSLLELLELPSLMDACVRGHLYEEALSIASFANTLERRHLFASSTASGKKDVEEDGDGSDNASSNENGNPVVANVVNEVRKREIDLRRHLLHRLRSDVSMPQCLEVVTALRRLNNVDLDRASQESVSKKIDLEKVYEAMERRLQVDFLEARDVWLEGTTVSYGGVSAAGTSSNKQIGSKGFMSVSTGKSEQLLDSIDLYRTRCFEITTQFIAIFRASGQQTIATSRILSSTTQDHAFQLLSVWTSRRVHYFLNKHLSTNHLSTIKDTATLRDVLDSATFFATSMGRIGADFSPLLASIFEPCLLSIIASYWMEGLNSLKETLKVCRDAGIASPLHSTTGSTISSSTDKVGTVEEDGPFETNKVQGGVGKVVTKDSKTPSPPRQLLSLPLLARLVNAFLTGLNELRRCLLPNTFPKLRHFFQVEFVKKAKDVLVQNERAVLTPGFLNQKGEEAGLLRSLAMEMKEEFDTCVQPYLASALEVALGVFENGVNELQDQKENETDDDGGVLDAEEVAESREDNMKDEVVEEDKEEVTSKDLELKEKRKEGKPLKDLESEETEPKELVSPILVPDEAQEKGTPAKITFIDETKEDENEQEEVEEDITDSIYD